MRLHPYKVELVEGSTKLITLDLSAIKGAATISSATFTSDPSGMTIAGTAISGGSVSCRVSGGTGGSNYHLVLTVVLSNGETDVGAVQVRWKKPNDTDSAGA